MMRILRAVLPLVCLAHAVPCTAQLRPKETVTLEASRQIVAAAEDVARANGWDVVIVVVDDGGHPVLLQRMDGAQFASVEIALGKARTAAGFRRPTRVLAEWVAQSPHLLAIDGAIPLEGGVPLVRDGRVVGAIGVSGVTAREDGVVAQAGADALQQLISR